MTDSVSLCVNAIELAHTFRQISIKSLIRAPYQTQLTNAYNSRRDPFPSGLGEISGAHSGRYVDTPPPGQDLGAQSVAQPCHHRR